MRRSATGQVSRSIVVVLALLAGALPSVGCSASRAAREKATVGMRPSKADSASPASREAASDASAEAASVFASDSPTAVGDGAAEVESRSSAARLPAVEPPTLADSQGSVVVPARLPPTPAEESSAAAALSSWPRERAIAATLVSDERQRSSKEALPSRSPQVARSEARRPRASEVRRVLHADKSTFDKHVLRSETPVLVDFYAQWCGPCKKLSPTLDELAAENPEARIVKIDIDDSPELASRYGVKSVPSLLIFKSGRVVAKQSGVVGKAQLLSMLDL